MGLMNDALMRNALKMVKSFIGPEQIQTLASDIIHQAIDYKNSIDLDVLNNEADAVAMLYEVGGEAHFCIAIMDPEQRIVRFEQVQTLNQLVEKMIEKY